MYESIIQPARSDDDIETDTSLSDLKKPEGVGNSKQADYVPKSKNEQKESNERNAEIVHQFHFYLMILIFQ